MMDPDEGPLHASSQSVSEPIPFLAIVNAILRNRLRIALLIAVLCFGVAAYTLLRPRTYVSDASFSLQSSDSHRGSGIAAQFGLTLPSSDGSQSPAYYVELLDSREILTAAAASQYSYKTDGRKVTGTLPQLYDIDDRDSAVKYDRAVRRLRAAITSDKSRETGIVDVSVSAQSPELAQQLLTRLLQLLNEFNLKTRQSQAANERRFIEQRMAEIGVDLRAAEDRLQNFLQRNRGGYASIPELSFEHDRLSREVGLRQQVYTSLAQNYEQARIDEVRDTPALTVIESPSLPVRPAPRGLVRRVFVALLIGLLLGTLPLLLRVLLTARRRSMDEEVEEFRRLKGELRLWRSGRNGSPPLTAREA